MTSLLKQREIHQDIHRWPGEYQQQRQAFPEFFMKHSHSDEPFASQAMSSSFKLDNKGISDEEIMEMLSVKRIPGEQLVEALSSTGANDGRSQAHDQRYMTSGGSGPMSIARQQHITQQQQKTQRPEQQKQQHQHQHRQQLTSQQHIPFASHTPSSLTDNQLRLIALQQKHLQQQHQKISESQLLHHLPPKQQHHPDFFPFSHPATSIPLEPDKLQQTRDQVVFSNLMPLVKQDGTMKRGSGFAYTISLDRTGDKNVIERSKLCALHRT